MGCQKRQIKLKTCDREVTFTARQGDCPPHEPTAAQKAAQAALANAARVCARELPKVPPLQRATCIRQVLAGKKSPATQATTYVGLVACGKEKQAGTHPAEELYTSPLFRGSLAWARAENSLVWIVSAKHGLLRLVDPVKDYELKLDDLPKAEREAWGDRVVADLARRLTAGAPYTLRIYGGATYVEAVRGAVQRAGLAWALETPFGTRTQGQRLQLLSQKGYLQRQVEAPAAAPAVDTGYSVWVFDPTGSVSSRPVPTRVEADAQLGRMLEFANTHHADGNWVVLIEDLVAGRVVATRFGPAYAAKTFRRRDQAQLRDWGVPLVGAEAPAERRADHYTWTITRAFSKARVHDGILHWADERGHGDEPIANLDDAVRQLSKYNSGRDTFAWVSKFDGVRWRIVWGARTADVDPAKLGPETRKAVDTWLRQSGFSWEQVQWWGKPPRRESQPARELAEPAVRVLDKTQWQAHHGGATGETSFNGGIWLQLTKIEADGVTAYVREGFRTDHFMIPANARLGMKEGRIPKNSRLDLQLAAPAEHWDRIAKAIEALDRADYERSVAAGQKREFGPRPVTRHTQFTEKTAPAFWEHWKVTVPGIIRRYDADMDRLRKEQAEAAAKRAKEHEERDRAERERKEAEKQARMREREEAGQRRKAEREAAARAAGGSSSRRPRYAVSSEARVKPADAVEIPYPMPWAEREKWVKAVERATGDEDDLANELRTEGLPPRSAEFLNQLVLSGRAGVSYNLVGGRGVIGGASPKAWWTLLQLPEVQADLELKRWAAYQYECGRRAETDPAWLEAEAFAKKVLGTKQHDQGLKRRYQAAERIERETMARVEREVFAGTYQPTPPRPTWTRSAPAQPAPEPEEQDEDAYGDESFGPDVDRDEAEDADDEGAYEKGVEAAKAFARKVGGDAAKIRGEIMRAEAEEGDDLDAYTDGYVEHLTELLERVEAMTPDEDDDEGEDDEDDQDEGDEEAVETTDVAWDDRDLGDATLVLAFDWDTGHGQVTRFAKNDKAGYRKWVEELHVRQPAAQVATYTRKYGHSSGDGWMAPRRGKILERLGEGGSFASIVTGAALTLWLFRAHTELRKAVNAGLDKQELFDLTQDRVNYLESEGLFGHNGTRAKE